MIVHTVAQRSPEWLALHVGRVTGSRALHVWKQRQKGTGELEGRATLRRQLVAERLTGQCSDEIGPFLPRAMQRGVELEPKAFAAYEAATGVPLRRVGFVEHDSLMAGCSPDGMASRFVGGAELKCPDSDTHLGYWQAGGVPEIYVPQVLHSLWVTGAQWWDFVSFDDRFIDPAMRLYRVRVERSSVDLALYEQRAVALLDEVDRDYMIAIGGQWERAAQAVAVA